MISILKISVKDIDKNIQEFNNWIARDDIAFNKIFKGYIDTSNAYDNIIEIKYPSKNNIFTFYDTAYIVSMDNSKIEFIQSLSDLDIFMSENSNKNVVFENFSYDRPRLNLKLTSVENEDDEGSTSEVDVESILKENYDLKKEIIRLKEKLSIYEDDGK